MIRNNKKIFQGLGLESIQTRLIFIFVLMVLVPAILVGVVSTSIGLQTGFDQAQLQLNTVASLKKKSIEKWKVTLLSDLEHASRDQQLNWHMSVLFLRDDSLALFRNTSLNKVDVELKKMLKSSINFKELFLIDLQGNVIFSTNYKNIAKNYNNLLSFNGGEHSFVIGPLLDPSKNSELSIIVAHAVYDENDQLIGNLAGNVNHIPLKNILHDRQGLGESGETFLVSNSGLLITKTRVHLNLKHADRDDLFYKYLKEVPKSMGKYQNYSDIPVIGIKYDFEGLKISMITEKYQSEAFAPIYKVLKISISVVFFSVFIAILLGISQTRHITAPLADLSKAASDISKTNLDIHVEHQGSLEVRQLVTAFNSMVLRIRNLLKDVEHSEKQHAVERERAEKANLAKSEFLSSMSHELRTPLNSVLGFAELLETSENLNDEQTDYTKHIISSGSHLLELITDILHLSAIESRSLPINFEEISTEAIIKKSISLVSVLAKKENVIININPSQNWRILADITKLGQILLNLISNAIKYNKKGGTITIDCKVMDDDFVRISVIDTGVGIDEDVQDKVFMAFNRLGMENSSIEGSGVGLLVSKNLAELMNGRLDFISVKNQGSTFWVDLPQAKKRNIENFIPYDEVSLAKNDTDIKSMPSSKKILYIEDNRANQDLMRAFFKRFNGLELMISSSGEEGRKKIENNVYDLILMDINLPGINGNNLAKELKKDESFKSIPIIAVTAVAIQYNREMETDLFDAYLTKPLKFSDLDNVLKENLS